VNFTPRTPRVVAARRLQRRKDRDQTGRFLAEGPQAVRAALAAGAVVELFGTDAGLSRYADLAARADVVSAVTDEALAALAETVHP
jgi:RNA methyltransferase, TrmH family